MGFMGARHRHITWLTSVPIGSGAIYDRYLPSDPPTYEEMEAARSYLAKYLQTIRIQEPPPALNVTGSSVSSLLKLAKRAFKLDEQSDYLTREDLSRCEGLLGALPAEEIAQRFGQRLERAHIHVKNNYLLPTMVSQYLNALQRALERRVGEV
jgi:exopolyphosphatase/pppGpp-phosphohydrolase